MDVVNKDEEKRTIIPFLLPNEEEMLFSSNLSIYFTHVYNKNQLTISLVYKVVILSDHA